MARIPKKGEFYLHFKNKKYQIVGIATHSETKESLVIYQALYGDYGIYARPLEMFVSEVDHVKYPEVKQKYRFTQIKMQPDGSFVYLEETESLVEAPAAELQETPQFEKMIPAEEHVSEDAPVNPKFMDFLDADTYDEKYNILVSMRDEIDNQMIDNLAVVMDLVIPEGEPKSRYEELKMALRTKQKYESADRLR